MNLVVALARPTTWAPVVLMVCLLAGCTPPLVTLMVTAPNRINPFVGEANPLPPIERVGTDQQFLVRVGPPEAVLSVSVVEPEPAESGRAEAAKGTVLVLHGIHARSLVMLHTARRLARAGYRSVLVDLRGHGRSSGEYLTYGVQEARDLSQVIDALQQRGLAAGSVGAYGVSYGATTAIHLAAIDRRVRAVVAIEPFSVLRAEVPHFGRALLPGGLFVPEATAQRALTEAGRVAGFDPDSSDAAEAIRKTDAPVLIAHGTWDYVTPYWQSVHLHQAAPEHSELITVPYRGHVALWVDASGELSQRATQWFDRWLTGATPAPAAAASR